LKGSKLLQVKSFPAEFSNEFYLYNGLRIIILTENACTVFYKTLVALPPISLPAFKKAGSKL
jgi:hypothetical protein